MPHSQTGFTGHETATSIRHDNGATVVRYHQTDVVTVAGNQITLDSGGWRTVTTKRRMNQAANEFSLPFAVYQRRGEWFVDYRGETLRFADGMTLQPAMGR